MSTATSVEPWVQDFVRLEQHIANALSYSGGTHTVEDVFVGIVSGQFQFWPGQESAVVTEFRLYPRKKTLHYFLCGGTLEELEQMQQQIEQWAKAQGCDAITTAGRPGWTKSFLNKQGFRPQWTVMSKELKDE